MQINGTLILLYFIEMLAHMVSVTLEANNQGVLFITKLYIIWLGGVI